MPREVNSISCGKDTVSSTDATGKFQAVASAALSAYRFANHSFHFCVSIQSSLGRIVQSRFEMLGSLIRSHASQGTSLNRETTAAISVCCLWTTSGSRYEFAPDNASGKNAKKLNCTGKSCFLAVIKNASMVRKVRS